MMKLLIRYPCTHYIT